MIRSITIPDRDDRSLRPGVLYIALLVVGIFLPGCQIDFGLMRRDHVEKFPSELSRKTLIALPEGHPAGLADCVRIALDNNLDIHTALINRRLAGLDRKIAFSNFLPHIDAGITYTSADRQQAIKAGPGYSPMSDKSIIRSAVSAQQAIFAPETWFLYEAFKKGEGISELVARRTLDLI
ncbi:MAG TPA: TolC family protein, partial [Phycisphaerae bacterium]|nr:TolC family protein [Phycisphaerae bacterium]